MNIFKEHEVFEMEVLEVLKNEKVTDSLVFGGGTMLRLCYDLNRYSVDLDFWFLKTTDHEVFYKKCEQLLSSEYDITDAQIKHFTLLFELRSGKYPRRLKMELRKKIENCDFQEKIAYSPFSNKQVILKVHTLEQSMKNKIQAAIDRKEIRDYFDIEFLLKKGVSLDCSTEEMQKLNVLSSRFTDKDFKVTLGSILEPEMRKYYIENKFSYLQMKLREQQETTRSAKK